MIGRLKYLFLAIVVATASQLSAQELLTLEQAIATSLENNFAVIISKGNAQIAQNNRTRGNAGFLPTLNLNASQSFTNQNVKQEFIGGTSNERDGATSDVFSAGAALNWVIFDGVKMFYTYEKLNELNRSGAADLNRVLAETVRDVTLAYYKVILEQNRLAILDSSIELSSERLGLAQSKYEVGKAAKLEYLTAQVDYNSDKSERIQQQETLNNNRIDLNQLMGIALDNSFTVGNQVPIDSTLILTDIMQLALANNDQLILAQHSRLVSGLEMKEINAEKFPVIGVNLGFNYSNLNSEAGFLLSNRTDGITYGVGATWSVFNGFNLQRRLQNARINVEITDNLLNQLKIQIESEVQQTYANYRTNLQLLALERENFAVAQENAAIALDRYRLGNSNALEWREAQNSAVSAAGRLIDAAYNTKIAEINLKWLSGQLVN